MGQSEAKGKPESDYASVKIQCDKDLYIAGETIRGNVFLSVTKGFPPSAFTVVIEGREIIKKGHAPESTPILSVSLPLQVSGMSGVIQPGKYTLPYEFPLPMSIPGTLQPVDIGGLKGRVAYSVGVSLASSDPAVPSIAHSVPFAVKQPLIFDQNVALSANKHMQSWCCLARGVSSITCVLRKSGLYYRAEDVAVHTIVDNTNCELGVTGLRFTLCERVKFGRGSQAFEKMAAVFEWEDKLAARAGGKTERESRFRVKPEPKGGQLVELETVTGCSISRTYRIIVTPVYDGCFVSDSPGVGFDLNITSAPLAIVVSLVQPQPIVNRLQQLNNIK